MSICSGRGLLACVLLLACFGAFAEAVPLSTGEAQFRGTEALQAPTPPHGAVRWASAHAAEVPALARLNEAGYRAHALAHPALQGAWFGAMLALLLLGLLGAVLLRQVVHVHYALLLAFLLLAWAALSGYGNRYLWPAQVLLDREILTAATLLTAVAALQFSRTFLRAGPLLPMIHNLLLLLQLALLAGIALRFTGLQREAHYLFHAAAVLPAALPVLAWLAYRQGLYYIRGYTVAWIAYGAGLALTTAATMVELPAAAPEALYYAQAGTLLLAILLLLALGERLLGDGIGRQQTLELANQDSLTGLGNRRALAQTYEIFNQRHARDGVPVYLLLIDPDGFSRIIATYGHGGGDMALRQLSSVLRRICRAEDTCVRHGPAEFAVLLQAPQVNDALRIADRIRAEFASTPTRHNGAWIHHTLSAGMTVAISGEETLDLREAINRADSALNQAKAEGRNRVMLFHPESGPVHAGGPPADP